MAGGRACKALALKIDVGRIAVLPQLNAQTYSRSVLHADDRIWLEKNCYVDIWIEVLHALQLDPVAMLAFALAIDFEGDQWTFFKPPHGELRELYGVDVQELNVWRPLLEHAVEHLGAGKLISTEADAFWLPDTAGTDYRRQHTKSTIVLADLDVQQGRLGYFHNAGYFELSGEDFVQTFRVGMAHDPTFMPLFAETIRINRLQRRTASDLAALSLKLLRAHAGRRPASNPVTRFRERFERDLGLIQERGMGFYHAWAFGTIRQLGAAFELSALHLAWLANLQPLAVNGAVEHFQRIATDSKALILKAARAINAKRALDFTAAFDGMQNAWQQGMDELDLALCTATQ